MGLRVRWIKIDDAHIAEVGNTPQQMCSLFYEHVIYCADII